MNMNIDTHVHLWQYNAHDYSWIDDTMPALRRNWLPQDLHPLLSRNGINACIAVQARTKVEETQFLLQLAEQSPWIAGVIGWLDLKSSSFDQQLQDYLSHPKFLGVRHVIQGEFDVAAYVAEPAVNSAVATVQAHKKIYEVLVKGEQLAAVTEFCARHDRHWLVLDHLGKPMIWNSDLSGWRKRCGTLPDMQHVVVKVSGMVTEAIQTLPYINDGNLRNLIRPFLDTALELFGAERLMYGSDWPVCLLATSYDEVIGIIKEWLASLSSTERGAIMGGNAQRVYQLQLI